ncbi:DUF1259 domain-containing protein [Paenibacillus thermotolerans]|uniref:DUF1259 domain-containing protein n=1 Tax=Paenibacillus thermotolerans TaxID=3027807 RepID=UPI002367A51E|nr:MULTISPECIES: DUF1259 domain-containing protein [unclassified Paenibacillus]
MKVIFAGLLCLTFLISPQWAAAAEGTDCNTIEKIFQAGVNRSDGVCKAEIVRKNLNVTLMGLKLSPEMMGLTFTAVFEQTGKNTAVVGEFALLEEEVNPVIRALQAGGLKVSALHNHMIEETPRILYVHFEGIGNLGQLAVAVKTAIDTTRK